MTTTAGSDGSLDCAKAVVVRGGSSEVVAIIAGEIRTVEVNGAGGAARECGAPGAAADQTAAYDYELSARLVTMPGQVAPVRDARR